MQVLILAGGLGTRLKSISEGRPKAMMLVNGRPFIEYQLEQLAGFGMTDIVLCVGYGGNIIQDHVGDGSRWGVQARYSFENPDSLLGTGGALVNALPFMKEQFMTLYGDSYLPIDFVEVADQFERIGHPFLMTVYKNEGLWDSSNTRIEGDIVTYYNKKAQPGEADSIDYGLSAIKRSVIEAYAEEPLPLDMARIQSELVASKQMAGFLVKERFYEIGKPEGLFEFEAWIKDN